MFMIGAVMKFMSLNAHQRWLLAEAVTFLFSAKVILLLLPLKTVMKTKLSHNKRFRQSDHNELKKIKWALHNADRMALWKNRCLVTSIAGQWMLQRRGIPSQLFFGVAKGENKELRAHAWLMSDSFEIVEKDGDYRELYMTPK